MEAFFSFNINYRGAIHRVAQSPQMMSLTSIVMSKGLQMFDDMQ